MAKIPEFKYDRSYLEEQKLYACTYTYKFPNDSAELVDTWHIKARSMSEACQKVEEFCAGNVDSGEWDCYEVVTINMIRKGLV